MAYRDRSVQRWDTTDTAYKLDDTPRPAVSREQWLTQRKALLAQ